MTDVDAMIDAAKAGSVFLVQSAWPYELFVQFPTVSVRDTRTRRLVAHSCMRADFEASVVEFAGDYLPERPR